MDLEQCGSEADRFFHETFHACTKQRQSCPAFSFSRSWKQPGHLAVQLPSLDKPEVSKQGTNELEATDNADQVVAPVQASSEPQISPKQGSLAEIANLGAKLRSTDETVLRLSQQSRFMRSNMLAYERSVRTISLNLAAIRSCHFKILRRLKNQTDENRNRSVCSVLEPESPKLVATSAEAPTDQVVETVVSSEVSQPPDCSSGTSLLKGSSKSAKRRRRANRGRDRCLIRYDSKRRRGRSGNSASTETRAKRGRPRLISTIIDGCEFLEQYDQSAPPNGTQPEPEPEPESHSASYLRPRRDRDAKDQSTHDGQPGGGNQDGQPGDVVRGRGKKWRGKPLFSHECRAAFEAELRLNSKLSWHQLRSLVVDKHPKFAKYISALSYQQGDGFRRRFVYQMIGNDRNRNLTPSS